MRKSSSFSVKTGSFLPLIVVILVLSMDKFDIKYESQ